MLTCGGSDAKVYKAPAPALHHEQDVLGLDVPMHNVRCVHRLQTCRDVEQQLEHVRKRQPISPPAQDTMSTTCGDATDRKKLPLTVTYYLPSCIGHMQDTQATACSARGQAETALQHHERREWPPTFGLDTSVRIV